MRYCAALIVEAERPKVHTIGRFTYLPRPVSAPAMLRVHAAASSGDLAVHDQAVTDVLRAAFPWSWRFLYQGHPARRILSLDTKVKTAVLRDLFRIPTSGDNGLEEDPYAAIRRAQRSLSQPDAPNGPAPTLATAVAMCRRHLGDAWYYNPARWNTVDGYVPFAVVWVEYEGLQTVLARERLNAAHAAVAAQSGKEFKSWQDRTLRDAYPGEPRAPLTS